MRLRRNTTTATDATIPAIRIEIITFGIMLFCLSSQAFLSFSFVGYKSLQEVVRVRARDPVDIPDDRDVDLAINDFMYTKIITSHPEKIHLLRPL